MLLQDLKVIIDSHTRQLTNIIDSLDIEKGIWACFYAESKSKQCQVQIWINKFVKVGMKYLNGIFLFLLVLTLFRAVGHLMYCWISNICLTQSHDVSVQTYLLCSLRNKVWTAARPGWTMALSSPATRSLGRSGGDEENPHWDRVGSAGSRNFYFSSLFLVLVI